MEDQSRHYAIIAHDYWQEKTAARCMEDFFIGSKPMGGDRPGAGAGFASVRFPVEPSIAALIKTTAGNHEMAEYIIYLSFYAVLLYRYYRQPEAVVWSPGMKTDRDEENRDRRFFFYRLAVKEGDPLKQVLKNTRDEIQETLNHCEYDFEDIRELSRKNHIDEGCLYWFGFYHNRMNVGSPEFEKVNLQLRLEWVSAGRLEVHLRYNTGLFQEAFICRMGSHYKNLLPYVDGGLDTSVAEIEILTAAEKRRLVEEFNCPDEVGPGAKTLVEIFEEKAGGLCHHIALQYENMFITYRELNEGAGRLARVLRQKGVGPGTVVGIMGERSLETIIGIVGILKAGGAYLPMDADYPKERIDYMLKDSGAKILLTGLPEGHKLHHSSNQFIIHHSSNLAYIIYTSGSTGKPKGVMVEHGNVVSLILNKRFSIAFGPGDVWILFHSLCFDFSVWELFGALVYGGKLVVVSGGTARTPRALAELLEQEKVTVLNQVPTAFASLAAEVLRPGKKRKLYLRYIIFGGEALRPPQLAAWYDRYPGVRLVNMYGITETTVHSTYKEIGRQEIEAGISNIGSALPGWQCYIVDHKLRPVPMGAAGEILIAGAGTARGYLNNPELTAEKFNHDKENYQTFCGGPGGSFSKEPPGRRRLYKSGDLGRWLPAGDIEFLGRIDHQVKIRGYRIECGEIETRLLCREEIKEAVVMAKDKSLAAFLVPAGDGEAGIDTRKIREYLHQYLPDYMIPEYFVILKRFPLTASGKVDKKALPGPGVRGGSGDVYEAPRTRLESMLVDIWQEVLGRGKIGIHDNFFDLGGNSIKGIQVVNKVQEWLEEIIHVTVLFEAPTVEELAVLLEKSAAADGIAETRVDEAAVLKLRQCIPRLAPPAGAAPKNPPAVFVLSPPRSGSTLLRVILAGHPGIFAPPELELLSFNTLQDRFDGLSGRFGYFQEGVIRAIMEIKDCTAGAGRVIMEEFQQQGLTCRQFYRVMQQWLGERLLVDKTPWYALDMEILKRAEEYFESPYYIHLVRDPYAVIHSFEKANLDQIFRYHHDFTVRQLAELIWIICHENIREFLREIPGRRQHEVKFEELVHRPGTVVSGLCRFLGLEYRGEMIHVYRDTGSKMLDGIHPESKMLGDINFLTHKGIDPGVLEKWKRDYRADFLGAPARRLAKLLGYDYFKIEPAAEAEYYELSNAQKRLWILGQFEEGISAYNIPVAYRLEGEVRRGALEKACGAVIQRHESLRTTFIRVEGEPRQRVHDYSAMGFKLEYFDLGNEENAEERAREFACGENRGEFHLEKGPLLRAKLLRLGEGSYVFLLTLHHIITDGWSMGVLVKEILQCYNAYARGRENPLPPLFLSYKDYSAWQNKRMRSGEMKRQGGYWLRQFAGEIPVLDLPTDFPRPAVQSFEGKIVDFEIAGEAGAGLKTLAREQGVTYYIVLLALFNIFLARVSNREDIIVGTPIAGRGRKELEQTVGMFVNTLAVRSFPAAEKSFRGFLNEVKTKILGAFENQDYPFEELVENVALQRDVGRNPLFDVLFSYGNDPAPDGITDSGIPGLKVTPFSYEYLTAKFDLALQVWNREPENRFLLSFEYCTKLFKDETMARFIDYFCNIVTGAVRDPEQELSGIEMISGEEKKRLLMDFNNTETAYPAEKSIPQLFAEQVNRRPDGAAVVCVGATPRGRPDMGSQHLSYRELNRKSNRLAHYLRCKGVGPDTAVGIMGERSIGTIIGILGILKAGGAYLPIDPDYPRERIDYMLKDGNVNVLLSGGSEESEESGESGECGPVSQLYSPLDLAYIIFTSGTTGRPKGVMVEHRSVVRLVKNTNYIRFRGDDRILQTGVLEFDASTFEVWGALLNGLALYLVEKEVILEPVKLGEVVACCGITTIWMTAPLFNRMVEADPSIFAGVRNLLVGGDVLSPSHINRVRGYYPRLTIINGYGPTENTTFSTAFSIRKDYKRNIPIGGPIANSTVIIVDRCANLQPIGIPGELWVGGAGVSRGYLNNPELSAEKFKNYNLQNDFNEKLLRGVQGGSFLEKRPPGRRRHYKTGDLCRWLPDGVIEFLGRMDSQVKIRGYRIETGEIENRLVTHEKIKEAVVTAGKDKKGDKYLCAYFVPHEGIAVPESELRKYLAEELPGYMIPSYFCRLGAIPLTVIGKPDWRALPSPRVRVGEDYTAPGSDLEERISRIWAGVLNLDQRVIGIDSNFFELGGHSLKATLLLSVIHKELGVTVSLTDIFKGPTIRELARYIETKAVETYIFIEAVEKKEYYAISSSQERLYILQRIEPANTAYNMPQVILLQGVVEIGQLEVVFKKLLRRHESFRTSFITVGEDAVQRIDDEVEFKIEYFDLAVDRKIQNSKFKIQNSFIRPFDLSVAPLLRALLIKTGEENHLLVVDMHHIVADGISLNILGGDFAVFYRGEERSPLRIQYKDFSQWQGSEGVRKELERQGGYWLEQFSGEIPVLDIAVDYPRPAARSFAGDAVDFEIPGDYAFPLKSIAREHGTTLYMVLLALFDILLARLGGREDIVVGTPVAGRRHADLEEIIGMFVNTLALRSFPRPGKSFSGFLAEVKKRTLEAFDNQEYSFAELVDKVAAGRDTSRNPLFDAMFVLENIHDDTSPGEIPGPGEDLYRHDRNTSKFDITLWGRETGDRLFFTFQYCTGLFKKETVNRFTGYFKNIVSAIVLEPGIKLAEIEILPEEEKRLLLVEFNGAFVEYAADKTLHGLFVEQAKRTPDHAAVDMGLQHLSYRELDGKSDRLAHYLRCRGVGADTIVGIVMGRSLEMIIGILGILKAGGAYLPIDPAYPEERSDYMLKDSNVRVLLSDVSQVIEGTGAVTHPVHPAHLCYVIYTSGSTGRPKGVAVEHRGVVNTLLCRKDAYRMNDRHISLQLFSYAFDGFVTSFFTPVISGAAVVLLTDEEALDIAGIRNVIVKRKVTHFIGIPVLFQGIMENLTAVEAASLKVVTLAGDILPPYIIEKAGEKNREMEIVNEYGVTESAVMSTICRHVERGGRIHIGKPVWNTRVYILNPAGNLQAIGVGGELCISGAGLARGYLNRPELTNEKFLRGGPGGAVFSKSAPPGRRRLYQTGDLGRWQPGGNIEFLGRLDGQVKIRGFRVEPGEIENRLLMLPGIREAVVVIQEDAGGDKYLCAYFVPGGEIDVPELKNRLAGELPGYMVPAYFRRMEKFPLTPGGKIDRGLLPVVEVKAGRRYQAPRTWLEEKLAVLWREVLFAAFDKGAGAPVGIGSDFFDLGGHSLKAAVLAAKIHREFDVDIPLGEIFRTPTIPGMAAYISKGTKNKYISIEAVEEKEYYFLTSAQKGVYMQQQMHVKRIAYNMPQIIPFNVALDGEKLESIFRRLLQRHESLRTSFVLVDGEPVQRVHREVDFGVEYYGAGCGGQGDIAGDFVRPFDLSRAPLMRVGLLETGAGNHTLLVDMHHIITDGVSNHIMIKEFTALYLGREPRSLNIRYKDYSVWKEHRRQRENKQKEWWLKEFADGVPILDMPYDFERPAVKSPRGHRLGIVIGEELNGRLQRLTGETGTSLYMVLLTAYYILLSGYAQQEDIVVGSPVTGRRHAELQHIVGMFINMLALRNRPEPHKTVREFLMEVKEKVIAAMENQDYHFEELVTALGLQGDPGRNPLFDAVFAMQNLGRVVTGDNHLIRDDKGESAVYGFESGMSRFDLLFNAVEVDGTIEIAVHYSTTLFKGSTAGNISKHYIEIVGQMVDNPDMKLREVKMTHKLVAVKPKNIQDDRDFGF